MDEFASARLVALVQRSLADEGIRVIAPRGGGALLPFEAKRRFLRGVARDHGLLPLLRAGALVPANPSDPAVTALLSAVGPGDLFARWQRLERFTHSRHRVVVRESGTGHLVAEHLGPPREPPELAEHALVLGVLTALLPLTGARDITVDVGRGTPSTVFADGAVRAAPPAHGSGLWRFTWSGTAPPVPPRTAPPVPPHIAPVVHPHRATAVHPGTGPPLHPPTAESSRDLVVRTRGLLGADLARRWTLAALAAEMDLPVRSLQRRLTGAGGFTGLLGELRTEAAAALLLRSAHSIGVIGFACGYADQPHFTRHFGLRTAMTPAAYRAAFRRTGPNERPGPNEAPGPAARTARTHEPARRRTA
ncbi:helix-turn-helix domain-containing protein [Streptomyces sp. NPDC020965]|uniref:helix-turn-helix domain-containing protein n=1 Tax=Streptomyces sp. NPDC020965 TaxID=3365105 RepID=UPI003797B644